MLALVATGLPRQRAYEIVQRSALAVVNEGARPGRFRELLGGDPDVSSRLDARALDACFDLDHHLRHVPTILARALGGTS
jgi:adenylosuccinate lyase